MDGPCDDETHPSICASPISATQWRHHHAVRRVGPPNGELTGTVERFSERERNIPPPFEQVSLSFEVFVVDLYACSLHMGRAEVLQL